jgi:response regulator receiver domain-containing protein
MRVRSTGRRCLSRHSAGRHRRNAVGIGRTTRPDGLSRLTYNDHPLHTFVNDKKPGDTNVRGHQRVRRLLVCGSLLPAPRSPLAHSRKAGTVTAAATKPIRCVIVDDHQPFLAAARLLVEREGVAVVGVAATSAEALRLEEELRPDVVLVDIRLGGESGFDLARRLRSPVILVSPYARREYLDASTPRRPCEPCDGVHLED